MSPKRRMVTGSSRGSLVRRSHMASAISWMDNGPTSAQSEAAPRRSGSEVLASASLPHIEVQVLITLRGSRTVWPYPMEVIRLRGGSPSSRPRRWALITASRREWAPSLR